MRNGAIAAFLVVAILAGAGAGYFAGSSSRPTSTSVSTTTVTTTITSPTTSIEVQGVVAGMVTVGGQVPSNISAYSVTFKPSPCIGSCLERLIPIYPSGHYSALLAPGNYTMGLYPSCEWSGCAVAFQNPVALESGQQIVVNIDIANQSSSQ